MSIARSQNVQLSVRTLNRDTFNRLIAPNLHIFDSLFPTVKHHPRLIRSPLALTQHECNNHRKQLEKTRDLRAQELGNLAILGSDLVDALKKQNGDPQQQETLRISAWIVGTINAVVQKDSPVVTLSSFQNPTTPVTRETLSDMLRQFFRDELPKHKSSHITSLDVHRRPHRWTLAWPRLVLVPPVMLLGIRAAYNNRDSIASNIRDAAQTIRSFWTQWVLEPIRDILNTVRTGGDDGARVISKEGLKSDMEV